MSASSGFLIETTGDGAFRIVGRLGYAEAGAALSRGRVLAEAQRAEVRVDLSGLEGIDSATLATLLAWSAHAERRGVRLRYEAAPPALQALAELCDAEPLLARTA